MQTAENPIESSVDRDQGSLTNLWELIQAAKDEDRQRAHEELESLIPRISAVLEEVQRRAGAPFVPDRRTD